MIMYTFKMKLQIARNGRCDFYRTAEVGIGEKVLIFNSFASRIITSIRFQIIFYKKCLFPSENRHNKIKKILKYSTKNSMGYYLLQPFTQINLCVRIVYLFYIICSDLSTKQTQVSYFCNRRKCKKGL